MIAQMTHARLSLLLCSAIIFRRLCVIIGILYLYRAACMISTVLPRANLNYYCSPQVINDTRSFILCMKEVPSLINIALSRQQTVVQQQWPRLTSCHDRRIHDGYLWTGLPYVARLWTLHQWQTQLLRRLHLFGTYCFSHNKYVYGYSFTPFLLTLTSPTVWLNDL